MKKKSKLLEIIAFLAIIGLLLASCDFLLGGNDSNEDENGSGGNTTTNPVVSIQNNTGFTINGIWIKPSTATNWGSQILLGVSTISNNSSKDLTISQTYFNENVDIRVSSSSSLTSSTASVFSRYSLSITKGQTITMTSSNLTNENYMPTITVQNRSGVTFNSVHIKPSVSSDWGTSFGSSLSNNSDRSITIPVPPTNFTQFDIQVRSTNPANTYTKNNVTISNGTIITFTSEDSDNNLVANPVIVIQNSTGFTLNGVWIKPSTATNWGSQQLGGVSTISNGSSRTFTLSQSLSVENIYDIRVSSSSSLTSSTASVFSNYSVTVYEGMILTLTSSNLTNENYMPTITVQNRSGVTFNSVHIKPSVSSDWGTSFGSSLSNNSDRSITIPVPPTNFTQFDIQVRSTNPANTYTKNNVNIVEGMVIIFTSADSDNSLVGNPIVVIQNNTSFTINGVWIRETGNDNWGSQVLASTISNGSSRTFTLSQPLSNVNSYDIRLSSSSSLTSSTASVFIKNNLLVSNGLIITFNSTDLQ